jgi:hypothetical protein
LKRQTSLTDQLGPKDITKRIKTHGGVDSLGESAEDQKGFWVIETIE